MKYTTHLYFLLGAVSIAIFAMAFSLKSGDTDNVLTPDTGELTSTGYAGMQMAPPDLEFVEVYDDFNRPVDIANAGDGSNRLFIVDAHGYIYIIDSLGNVLETPFLDIDTKVLSGGEQGLLGVIFHPDYETNGFFFVNYTNNSGDTRIARYSVDGSNPNLADPTSEKIMFAIDQPYNNHNGGDMAFSPIDGYLYIATGDGGDGGDPHCHGQDTTSLLGKILRVDVDQNINTMPYYGIPGDNPFAGSTPGRDEIWSYGLRNPWRISFDRQTGDLWIADVGQGTIEEVNFQPFYSPGGENYGWRLMEGLNCFVANPNDDECPSGTPACMDDELTDPIFQYDHNLTTGGRSITGGFVYRGCRFPSLNGFYIAIDYISDNAWLIDSLGNSTLFADEAHHISSFGESESGELYAAKIEGEIYKVRDANLPQNLILDESDSPLLGIYEAEDTIILQGVLTVEPNKTATLIAGHIIIENELTVNNSSIVQVERNCGN